MLHDLSDEATELPPLHHIATEDSMLALQWMVGAEGVVDLVDETLPVRYLSLRGLALNEEGAAEYVQVHIALPHHAIRPLLEQWLKTLDDTPQDEDSDA